MFTAIALAVYKKLSIERYHSTKAEIDMLIGTVKECLYSDCSFKNKLKAVGLLIQFLIEVEISSFVLCNKIIFSQDDHII